MFEGCLGIPKNFLFGIRHFSKMSHDDMSSHPMTGLPRSINSMTGLPRSINSAQMSAEVSENCLLSKAFSEVAM